MLAGFCRRLVGKTLINVFHCNITEIRFVGKLVIIQSVFINQRIECYLNNTITLRPLTPHMRPMPCYTHKMAVVSSYRSCRFCDVISPYVYRVAPNLNALARKVMKSVVSVRLCVRLFSLLILNRLTFDLNLCTTIARSRFATDIFCDSLLPRI